MKKFIPYLLLLVVMVVTSPVNANMRYSDPGWSGDLGLTGYYYHYQEKNTDDNSFFMRDKGPLYGFYYSFGYQFECTLLRLAADGFYAGGSSIRYKSAGTDQAKNLEYTALELRLLASYPWTLQNGWTLEGYTGLGARVVHDHGYNTFSSTGHLGYDRVSSYSYAPIGLRFIKPFGCDMHFIGHVEYDWFLAGVQRSYIDGVLENDQDHGFGLRAGVDLYIPSRFAYFDYLVGTFIRYWHIGDSTVNTSSLGHMTGLEPKNTTYEIGIRIGLVF